MLALVYAVYSADVKLPRMQHLVTVREAACRGGGREWVQHVYNVEKAWVNGRMQHVVTVCEGVGQHLRTAWQGCTERGWV